MFELLPSLVADELSFEDRMAVLEALRTSPALRQELERWQHLFLLLGAATVINIAPPADLSQHIVRRIALRQYLHSRPSARTGKPGRITYACSSDRPDTD